MNQNEFFNILMDGLKDFPETKLQDIISYYENNFVLGLASGKTEQEIVTDLGNPTLIVTKYRNEYLNIPINSEYPTSDADITPTCNKHSISDSNSSNNNNFINKDTPFTKEQNIITDNNYIDILSDFKTNNSFINDNDLEGNNKLNTFKTSDSYGNINSNQSNYNLTGEVNNNNNKDTSSFNSNNSNYNFNIDRNPDSSLNNFNNQNSKNNISRFNINTILKICIGILSVMIFFPIITGVIGCIIGLFGVALSILVASIGVLVGGTFTSLIGLPNLPMFVANFPYPVLVLFSLGSILLSIFLIISFYYLCKFFIKLSIKIYTSLKSEGGVF